MRSKAIFFSKSPQPALMIFENRFRIEFASVEAADPVLGLIGRGGVSTSIPSIDVKTLSAGKMQPCAAAVRGLPGPAPKIETVRVENVLKTNDVLCNLTKLILTVPEFVLHE